MALSHKNNKSLLVLCVGKVIVLLLTILIQTKQYTVPLVRSKRDYTGINHTVSLSLLRKEAKKCMPSL